MKSLICHFVLTIIFFFALVSCKKDKGKLGLFGTRAYKAFQVYSNGDTVVLGSVTCTIEQGNDISWNGMSFQASNVTFSSNPFGNYSYDAYVKMGSGPGSTPHTLVSIVNYYLLYAPELDKIIVKDLGSPQNFWVSY
jgi:hypothetical protein